MISQPPLTLDRDTLPGLPEVAPRRRDPEPNPGAPSVSLRQGVIDGFRDRGHGVGPAEAQRAAVAFYRRSGGAWTRHLR
ncbi:MAG: hypothetical protein ACFCGT_03290 [Sandaracinaceae bacterium]